MQNNILQYVANEFSVGNWAQNTAFYTLILLLSWVLVVQMKTSARLSTKKKRAVK
ncbi:hypothetical protein [Mucilaginibacter celer]|uniref:hypothetical protein n=1 Tax=Mucilaginibacter celer TaxID=2305508 RepID=UPI0013CF03A6|nr:hypothetical protein [Mucilaginibacter celer]